MGNHGERLGLKHKDRARPGADGRATVGVLSG